MNEHELRELIDIVASDFERSSGLQVPQMARRALFAPALAHLEEVTRALEEQSITVPFLAGAVREILDNAIDEVRLRDLDVIDERAIKESMARYCPYLFWC